MMHLSDIVVTIKNLATKETCREQDCGVPDSPGRRERQVSLPFGTEFAIGFRNNLWRRRRVEITINGTKEPLDIILGYGQALALERYTNSDRRFRLDRLDSAGVADPSEQKNGEVRVKVWTERATVIDATWFSGLRTPTYTTTCGISSSHGTHTVGFSSPGSSTGDLSGFMTGSPQSIFHLSPTASLRGASFGNSPSTGAPNAAVTEGQVSGQRFSETIWGGDDFADPLEFVFKLRGYEYGPPKGKAVFCHACGTKHAAEAKFCHNCGAPRV